MTATTHSEFGHDTEALEVAKAFPESVRGKTILVTGVNRDGIGFTTCQAFASQSPAHLIVASRSPDKIQQCINALKADYPNVDYRALQLDLGSQKAVRESAAELMSWNDVPSIDIVVNNAAVMNLPERQLSEEGIERTFATNHIGHFLFTCLIMSKLVAAAKGKPKGATRVVNVTSLSPTTSRMRWSDINQEKVNKTLPADEQPNYDMHKMFGATNAEEESYLPLEGYNQSKVANVLFSIALNKRLYENYGILSVACHPGIIFSTELGRYASGETKAAIGELTKNASVPKKTIGAGSSTTIVSALDPKLGLPETRNGKENIGAYLMDCQISDQATPGASSSSEAEKLWKLSEELVKENFAL